MKERLKKKEMREVGEKGEIKKGQAKNWVTDERASEKYLEIVERASEKEETKERMKKKKRKSE